MYAEPHDHTRWPDHIRRVQESIQVGLELQLSRGYSNFLPYAFPLVKGRPMISRKLVEYLKKH